MCYFLLSSNSTLGSAVVISAVSPDQPCVVHFLFFSAALKKEEFLWGAKLNL